MSPRAIAHGVCDDPPEVDVSPSDIARGSVTVPCPACEGTGTFALPDDREHPCVECSTRGTVEVSV